MHQSRSVCECLAAPPGAVPPGERERMSTVKFDELLAECEVERKE